MQLFLLQRRSFSFAHSVSPSIAELRSEGIPAEGLELRERERERCLSSSLDQKRADFRRNDARGISNSIARNRCTCLRKRISARCDARKDFDRIHFIVSFPFLFLSLALYLCPSRLPERGICAAPVGAIWTRQRAAYRDRRSPPPSLSSSSSSSSLSLRRCYIRRRSR